MQEQEETTENNAEVKYAEVKYTKAQIKQANLFLELTTQQLLMLR